MFYEPNMLEQDDKRIFSGNRYRWNKDLWHPKKPNGGTISRKSNVIDFQQFQIKDDHFTFQDLLRI